MNEENMSLPSDSDLVDEIKALKIENNILKNKIKSYRQIYTEKTKTEAKMRFYAEIASVALFNTVFTLIKPYVPRITY